MHACETSIWGKSAGGCCETINQSHVQPASLAFGEGSWLMAFVPSLAKWFLAQSIAMAFPYLDFFSHVSRRSRVWGWCDLCPSLSGETVLASICVLRNFFFPPSSLTINSMREPPWPPVLPAAFAKNHLHHANKVGTIFPCLSPTPHDHTTSSPEMMTLRHLALVRCHLPGDPRQ